MVFVNCPSIAVTELKSINIGWPGNLGLNRRVEIHFVPAELQVRSAWKIGRSFRRFGNSRNVEVDALALCPPSTITAFPTTITVFAIPFIRYPFAFILLN